MTKLQTHEKFVNTEKPHSLTPHPAGIPDGLKLLPQWVVWRWEWDTEKKRWVKPPYQLNGKNKASSTNAKTWTTFEKAMLALTRPGSTFDGIGFALTADDPYVVIDADKCRVAETGKIRSWSDEQRACRRWSVDVLDPIELVGLFGSCTEVSPSGTGLHIWLKGSIPKAIKSGSFECYDRERFIYVTGHRLEDTPSEVTEVPNVADFATAFDVTAAKSKGFDNVLSSDVRIQSNNSSQVADASRCTLPDDATILARARTAANGDKFCRLFDGGDIGGYPSPSEADEALCALLAFWCGNDRQRITGLFMQSSLVREKTERPDYLPRTIDDVLKRGGDCYKWNGVAMEGGREAWRPSLGIAEGQTDSANAARLAMARGEDIRWCKKWQSWLVWNGRRWVDDEDESIDKVAKSVTRKLWRTIGALKLEGNSLKRVITFVKSSNQAAGIRNMLTLTRSEPGVPIRHDIFNTKPMLLNVHNGTIDLETGKLRGHRRDDYLTKMVMVDYDPAATCPRWLKFLDEVFNGNTGLAEFIQRAAGYSLTGRTSERCLFFLHGKGKNGKTTLMATLQAMLADYAATITTDLLSVKHGQSHPTEVCDFFGVRVAISNETEEGRRMAESLVKLLTGGEDKLKARRMREDFWEFKQTHKLWVLGNHKPVIRGTDDAIWDRFRLVPFDVRFDEPDVTLASKLIAELPGILAWAVRGCLTWQRGGLAEPPEVKAATAAYRSAEDIVSRFLDEECTRDSQAETDTSAMFEAFKRWAELVGEKILSQRAFGLRLSDLGYQKGRDSRTRRMVRRGVRILPQQNPPD